jgi:glycine cleavage system H lipoate-binding protein
MKGGVVNFRRCDNDFDCNSCPFDKGMRKAMGVDKEIASADASPQWVSLLQQRYPGGARPCRHALTGRIDAPKICPQNYECYHCAFDQMLDEMDLVSEVVAPAYRLASGYKMADGYYYHLGHTWTRFEHGGRVRVGFDDFAVKVFGIARRLDLPPLGEAVQQGRVGWTFARNGHEAAVLAPVTGKVLALNYDALNHPEIVGADPYHSGWLLILEPAMPKRNLKGLFFDHESLVWMEKEVEKLMALLGPEYERLAATGSQPIADVFGQFPEIGWDRLVKRFLRSSPAE